MICVCQPICSINSKFLPSLRNPMIQFYFVRVMQIKKSAKVRRAVFSPQYFNFLPLHRISLTFWEEPIPLFMIFVLPRRISSPTFFAPASSSSCMLRACLSERPTNTGPQNSLWTDPEGFRRGTIMRSSWVPSRLRMRRPLICNHDFGGKVE